MTTARGGVDGATVLAWRPSRLRVAQRFADCIACYRWRPTYAVGFMGSDRACASCIRAAQRDGRQLMRTR